MTNARDWSGKTRQPWSTRMRASSSVNVASAALIVVPATAVRRALVAKTAISRSDVVVLQRSIGNWVEKDCVFAAILKVFGKESKQAANSTQGEAEDFQNESNLAAVLGFNTGPVDDPVLWMLMERLGWPRQTHLDTWNKFVAGANKSKISIVSFDMVPSGAQSHVVVVAWDGSKNDWRVFDRHGRRLKLGDRKRPHADNPLDAWLVTNTAAAVAIRDQLN